MLRGFVLQFAAFSILASAPSADELSEPDGGKTVSGVPYDKPGVFSAVQPVVRQADFVGVSPPLGELLAAPVALVQKNLAPRAVPIVRRPQSPQKLVAIRADPVLQAFTPSLAIPSPSLTFEGISNADNSSAYGFQVYPPDTNGDVGPSNYVQFANLLYRVYDKGTGAALTPPLKLSSLFASCGCPCGTGDAGDPVVLYDPLADRWLLTQFTNPNVLPYFQCLAISQTGDPTAAYYVYAFQMPNSAFNDYPKFGVWPDAYYMSDNQFGTFGGAGAFAFDRAKMLAGDSTASYIYFNLATLDANIFGLLPSDLDGPPPPVGAPNDFTYITANALRIFRFHADFSNPTASTFTEIPESPVAVAPFTELPVSAAVPQPNTTQLLDGLGDRLMFRLQYRNFGSFESLVVNHSVNAGSQAGVRYYQLRRSLPGGSFSVYDQATYAPADGLHRWMGSAALDNQANFAVGYSVSGTNQAPSIRYAGRLATDPTNSLSQGESTLVAGGGSQRSADRWGDYSMLAVDPNDDCTFWYTTEYYSADSSFSWRTRIGNFKFSGCTAPPKGALSGGVNDATSGLPIPAAIVKTDNGFLRATGNAGTYSMTVAPGTFNMTALAAGYASSHAAGVSVSGGGVATQNFTLARIALPTFLSSALNDSLGNNNGQVDPNECLLVNVVVTNKGKATASAIVATLSTPANAPASDNVTNTAYNDGWQSGDNGGAGFGPWLLSPQISGNTAGFFIGDSNNNGCFNDGFGNCPPCGPGINIGGKAWGVYANTTNLAEAVRTFSSGGLFAGQTFSIDMDNGCLDGAGTAAGFGLQNAGGENRFEGYFAAGDSVYRINDASSNNRATGIGFTQRGVRVALSLTGADSYSVSITRLVDGVTTNITGTLAGAAGSLISRLRLFYYNTDGGGGTRDVFFNNLSLSSASAGAPVLAIVQPTSGYPDLLPGASAMNSAAFRINTSASLPCGFPIPLTLVLDYSGGSITNTFHLIASAASQYTITQSSGASIVPGTTDTGNHCDDCTTAVDLPFAYSFYRQTYTNIAVSSNGNIQFGGSNLAWANDCLPDAIFGPAIFAHWDDLMTTGTVNGIFTSTSGVAPNRIFNVEWRAIYYGTTNTLNFEARLYEGQQRFDLIYGTLNGNGSSATVGVERDSSTATQFECSSGGLSAGLQLTFQLPPCPDGGGQCDFDGDGTPDWWMLQNFGHPTGQAADNSRAGDDADGDGMTNLHEFLSGTDPHNGASALRIGSVLKSGNDFIVSFPTVLDKLYRVERTDDLATASWTTVIDNIPGTGGSVAISDPGAAAQPKRFYRVKLLP